MWLAQVFGCMCFDLVKSLLARHSGCSLPLVLFTVKLESWDTQKAVISGSSLMPDLGLYQVLGGWWLLTCTRFLAVFLHCWPLWRIEPAKNGHVNQEVWGTQERCCQSQQWCYITLYPVLELWKVQGKLWMCVACGRPHPQLSLVLTIHFFFQGCLSHAKQVIGFLVSTPRWIGLVSVVAGLLQVNSSISSWNK